MINKFNYSIKIYILIIYLKLNQFIYNSKLKRYLIIIMKINCKNNLERNGTKKKLKNFKYDNDYDYDNIGINRVKNFIKALKIIYQNF